MKSFTKARDRKYFWLVLPPIRNSSFNKIDKINKIDKLNNWWKSCCFLHTKLKRSKKVIKSLFLRRIATCLEIWCKFINMLKQHYDIGITLKGSKNRTIDNILEKDGSQLIK